MSRRAEPDPLGPQAEAAIRGLAWMERSPARCSPRLRRAARQCRMDGITARRAVRTKVPGARGGLMLFLQEAHRLAVEVGNPMPVRAFTGEMPFKRFRGERARTRQLRRRRTGGARRRPRARRSQSRSAGGGSSGNPDEPEPGEARQETQERHLKAVALYAFGCLSATERGVEVEPVP